jgi:hypothetical protein
LKLTHLLTKEQGPMLLVFLILSAGASLSLTDVAGWEDPTLTWPNKSLRILKRDNLQLNGIINVEDRIPKGHIKVLKRGKYHTISPPSAHVHGGPRHCQRTLDRSLVPPSA